MKKWRNKITGEINEFMVHKRIEDSEDGNPVYAPFDGCIEEWEDYEEPKDYWTVECGVATEYTEGDKKYDRAIEAVGLKFDTKEECERAIEKMKAWKRLKDKGFRFHDWKEGTTYSLEYEWEGIRLHEIEDDLDLLFGGEE